MPWPAVQGQIQCRPQQCCCKGVRQVSQCDTYSEFGDNSAKRRIQNAFCQNAVRGVQAEKMVLGSHPHVPELLIVWPEVVAPAAHAVCLGGSKSQRSEQACSQVALAS